MTLDGDLLLTSPSVECFLAELYVFSNLAAQKFGDRKKQPATDLSGDTVNRHARTVKSWLKWLDPQLW